MRYAVVKNEKVSNVVVWDGSSPFEPDGELIELEDSSPIDPRWLYRDGKWVAPQPREGDPNRP